MYYISKCSEKTITKRRLKGLYEYLGTTPVWVPHREVAKALGHGDGAINAVVGVHGPYVWATEFENVHALWDFTEPGFSYDGVYFKGPEQLYQLQKLGGPRSVAFQTNRRKSANATAIGSYTMGQNVALRRDWSATVKDDAMRRALFYKFIKNDELWDLLTSTAPHPLISIKDDNYWGIGLDGTGDNRLPMLLMDLRSRFA